MNTGNIPALLVMAGILETLQNSVLDKASGDTEEMQTAPLLEPRWKLKPNC